MKDQVEEGEEQAALVSKELRAKSHDYELLKRDHAESVRAVQLLQAALASQQAMLQERGLVLMGSGEEGVEESEAVDEMEQEKRTRAIVSQETANILSGLGKSLNLLFTEGVVIIFINRHWTIGCPNKAAGRSAGRPAGHCEASKA